MKLSFAILIIVLATASCINQFGMSYPAHRKKTIRKETTPSLNFNHAFFQFRKENGTWPKTDTEMRYSTPKVINEIYNSGFESLEVVPFSQDTAYIFWTHEPVFNSGRIGIIPIPEKKVF